MKRKTNLIFLTAVFFSVGIYFLKVKEDPRQEGELGGKASDLKPGPAEKSEEASPLKSPPSKPSSPAHEKEEGEDKATLIPINIRSKEIPKYFEIVDEVDAELLKIIRENAEQVHLALNAERFAGQATWMKGLYLGTIAFQLPPNELPTKGYISDDFFFYLEKRASRFAKGFAVNRKNGKIFKWDTSGL